MEHPLIHQEVLSGYLTNPGRFSILVLGRPGSGKSHWIAELWKASQEGRAESLEECPFITKSASLLPSDESGLLDWLSKANNGLLVVDHVEELNQSQQEVLFDLMSTNNSEGCFGRHGSKDLKVRVVFTTSLTIDQLLGQDGNERRLSDRFFVRIAQLVVQFPSFAESSQIDIKKAFKVVWGYMWPDKPKLPAPSFLDWLDNNVAKLHGNYRDLEKLAINWRHWQQQGITDTDEIQRRVVDDFNRLFHSPNPNAEELDVFYLDSDKNYDDMLKAFRKKVREWSKQFGNPTLAAKKLGVSKRTMERW